LREPLASVRLHDGTAAERPLRQLTAGEVVAAVPWRPARSARGQAHYPGYYWSATAGGHVIYESRLELARLLLADFDPGVTAIAAQPFLLRAQAGGRLRRHVPDFLLVRADRTVQVVNVKPAARLADPAVAEALAWPGPLFEARGWDHEIWTGTSPVLLENVRFLAGYRRPGIPPMTWPPRSWARPVPANASAACWTGWSGPGRALSPRRRSCGCCGSGGWALT
jgi:hypothetical protein